MLYISNATTSSRQQRKAWSNRPAEAIDNPVKKYLRKRRVSKTSLTEKFQQVFGTRFRPAY